MAYNNSTDALRQLVLLRLYGSRITRSSDAVSVLTNGLPYFFVEVTWEGWDSVWDTGIWS